MTAQHCVSVGSVTCGSDQLFLISGPCVIEDESIMMHTAERLKTVSQRLSFCPFSSLLLLKITEAR